MFRRRGSAEERIILANFCRLPGLPESSIRIAHGVVDKKGSIKRLLPNRLMNDLCFFLRSRIVILGGPASAGSRHANPHGRDTGPQTIDLSADDYSESGDENSPWRKPDRE